MNKTINASNILSGIFAVVLLVVAILNMVLVHPVPGIMYLLLALLYLPQTNVFLKRRLGFQIPAVAKIILAIVLFMFTLGVSDLGDMIDKM
ncbi:hypothetical protein [uncultured Pontibacter sp.]|uniref:hypothetical protein n=1 Tax=uncultured Pontibacter sp. TaxID=453356 RepID=UPI002618510C|nr:hypothetical protein [uncultured Pontibacter sp.]